MLALLAALPLALPLQAPGGEQPAPIQEVGEDYILTFDETGGADSGLTMEAFVKLCQQATGLNFTYTDETKGQLQRKKLRMFGQKTIPKQDFYSFFQIMMVIHQFVTIKVGPPHLSVVLVISLETNDRNQVKRSAIYVTPEELDEYEDQPATLITTVMHLPNTDVRTLSNSMRTMLTDANTQQIIPVGNSNGLILTGFGSDVVALARMLQLVDEASASESTVVPVFEVIPLEFAAAEEIASTIEELLEASRRAVQGRAQQVQQAQGVSGQLQAGQTEAKILVDPRTNSLLVMAMPDDMPRIKELVARLDVEVIERERSYHIVLLDNVSAEDLAEVLEDFLRDASRIDTRPGAAGRAQAGQAGGGATQSSSRSEFVVVPDPTTNSLLVAANRTRYEEVLDLIRRLDKRQDQVLIETALIELSGNELLDIGVELGGADLSGDGEGQFGITRFGLSTFQDTNNDGIPDVRVPNEAFQGISAGILSGDDFNLPILITALKTRQDTNVLNVPSVLVNNNGHATVVAKNEQPTTTITLGTGGAAATQENFNEYVEAGITLEISPSISASNYLRLGVMLEVSTFQGAVSGSIPPPRATRTIETTVNVPDGDTMVIGGIIQDNSGKTHAGLPILGDIPVLGYLFRRDSDSQDRTSLYFFITPHIMNDEEFGDLAEFSYRMKLEAADTIGADRIRIIDDDFQREGRTGVNLQGFDLPLHRSPPEGEVGGQEVGMDPNEVHEILREGQAAGGGDDR